MASVRVILIICILTLLCRDTLACDNECTIIRVTEGNANLTLAGESHGRVAHIWIKTGESFEKIVFKLKVDKTFDFHGDVIHENALDINATELSQAIPKEKLDTWNKINVSVIDLHVTFWPDRFNIQAQIEEKIFLKDTRLFPLTSEIKAIQVWVQGDCELSFNCHPCLESQKLSNFNFTLNDSENYSINTESVNPTKASNFEYDTVPQYISLSNVTDPRSTDEDTMANKTKLLILVGADNQESNSIISELDIGGNETESLFDSNINSTNASPNNSVPETTNTSPNNSVPETTNITRYFSEFQHTVSNFLNDVSRNYGKALEDLSRLSTISDYLNDEDSSSYDYLENEDILDVLSEITRSSQNAEDEDPTSRAKQMQLLLRQFPQLQRLISSSDTKKGPMKQKKPEKNEENNSKSSEKMQLLMYVLIGLSGLLVFFLIVVAGVLIAFKVSRSGKNEFPPGFTYLSEKQDKEDNVYDEVKCPSFLKAPVMNGYSGFGDKKVMFSENVHSHPENYVKRHPISKKQSSDSYSKSNAPEKSNKHKVSDEHCNGEVSKERNKAGVCMQSDQDLKVDSIVPSDKDIKVDDKVPSDKNIKLDGRVSSGKDIKVDGRVSSDQEHKVDGKTATSDGESFSSEVTSLASVLEIVNEKTSKAGKILNKDSQSDKILNTSKNVNDMENEDTSKL